MFILLVLFLTACGARLPLPAEQQDTITETEIEVQEYASPSVASATANPSSQPRPTSTPEPTATETPAPSQTPINVVGELPENVVVTYVDDGFKMPRGCDMAGVTNTLMSIVEATNQGKWTQYRKHFDFIGDFEEFYSDDFRLYTLPDVQRYFMQRQQQQEHWELRKILFFNDVQPFTGLYYLTTRKANDLPEHLATGKVVMKCEEGKLKIVRWVHYGEGDSRPGWCPEPPDGTSSKTVVVCTFGWREE